jgi:hypothetical protein
MLSLSHKRFRPQPDFLSLILPSIGKDLNRRRSLETNHLKQFQAATNDLLGRSFGKTIEDGVQSTRVLDGLSTSLSLIWSSL